MRIKSRINVALGVVLVLHLSTAIMGHIGLDRSQSVFATYQAINNDTIRVLGIDKSIAELQRNITMYMLSGNTSSADRVRQLIVDIQTALSEAERDTDQQGVSDLLNAMQGRIVVISEDFEKVVIDRESRTNLVDVRMVQLNKAIAAHVDSLSTIEPQQREMILNRVSQAKNNTLLYFDRPERSHVQNAVRRLDQAMELAHGMGQSEAGRELVELINEYKQTFLAAVQSTRGYLHLVNVVLAGQTYELLYESTTIKDISLTERVAVEQSMQKDARRFQAISDIVAFFTVATGVVAAWMIIRTVLGPIQRITTTFHELAEGKQTTQVLNQYRNDEIGSMARAAEVFRLKNIETNTLLDQARVLGESLEKQNAEMAQFVYTVSHDLKSPVVTIHGFAGLLEDSLAEGNYEDALSTVKTIEAASMRMSRTIHDLLELSRVGMVQNEPARIHFQGMCNDVLQDLHGVITESNAVVNVEGQDQYLIADEVRMRQIVQNLINNAIVHGIPSSGSPIIMVELIDEPERQVITVSDNGPGIEPEYRDRVFALFQQLTGESQGTGVGLAIIKKIAESHDGAAWVETSSMGGAKFCVSISRQHSNVPQPIAV